ncbi:hypothetical protein Sango_1276800 [Sesamum angolense]|uniref:Uncharacterized protein n=1 Tax=Sesamum angolense TaxID=2727404 RepID=A0AAE2BUF9_9LAMI|nr:hypothetical protein Sango_1276800 [Sesamum angolense]
MLLIRHNLDVMHTEKNVFENIFNTIMDIKGKTNDNLDIRRDLKIIFNRPELDLDERRSNVMPKAVYTLGKEQKRVCEWIRGLKFSDGYASNFACCIDMMELQMHGMKSHNCHVFMQKLIPVAFRKMLSEHVWNVLAKLSLLLQSICSTMLDVHKLHELKNSVAIILGNLEKIFSFLRELKKKVKNKAHVEASIVEAYIVKEIDLVYVTVLQEVVPEG